MNNIPTIHSIPTIVHCYWDNPSTLTFMNLITLLSFNKHNPKWKIILWMPQYYTDNISWIEDINKKRIYDDNQLIFYYIKNTNFIEIKYIDFDKIGFSNKASEVHKSYYLRYYVLYTYGGIWSEMDIIYIKPLFELNYDNFLCKSTTNNNIKCEYVSVDQPYSEFTYYHLGFMVAKKSSNLMRFLLNKCIKFYNPNHYQSIGSFYVNDILSQFTNVTELFDENNCILSNEYYLPYQWYNIDCLFNEKNINHNNQKNPIEEKTIGIHWFNGHNISKDYIENTLNSIKNKTFTIKCFIDKYVNDYINTIKTIYNINKLSLKYLIYCYDTKLVTILESQLGLIYNSVNTNGLLTDKYYRQIYLLIKSLYNQHIHSNIDTVYDIFSKYKFDQTLIVTYNLNTVPNILKHSCINISDSDIGIYIRELIGNNNVYIYTINKSYNKKLCFINEPTSTAKYYTDINETYKKILQQNNYTIVSKQLMINNNYNTSLEKINECISLKDHLFVINPINFATLIYSYNIFNSFYFINNINYIVIWQEILKDDLSIIGYDRNPDKAFIKNFFTLSKLNIVGNLSSLNALYKLDIYHNIYYNIGGYSEINSIVPTNYNNYYYNNNNKYIDVLIYGTLSAEYSYRNNLINMLQSKKQNLNIIIGNNFWGKQLDNYLNSTKIVLHIPSHENCNHIPWAKINYLQAKKCFFIIEENQELTDLNLNFIPVYKRNDINDLINKIKHFIENKTEMETYIQKNYDYIYQYCNLDKVVPNIIKNI